MKQIIGKKSYLALIIHLMAFLLCSLIVVVTFLITNEWVIRFVISFVFGLGSLITLIPLIIWIITPRNLVVVDGTQIFLPSKKANFYLCDISSISGFEEPNRSGSIRFWAAISKYGHLTVRLKNGKKYSLKYIENIMEVERKLQTLLNNEKSNQHK